MKDNNRKEEALAKAKVAEQEKANELAYREMRERMAICSVPMVHEDKRPTTRRDLLSAGLIGGFSYALVPGLLSSISKKAYADIDCSQGSEGASSGANKMPGFLQINARGGWSSAMQFAPGKQRNGAFEPISADGYVTNGLGTSQIPQNLPLIEEYGIGIQPNSPFFAGIMSVISPEALNNTRLAYMPQASGDDTGNNELEVTKFAARVQGLQFALAPVTGSTRNREAVRDPNIPIANVRAEGDLGNLVDPGLVAERLSPDAAVRIARAATKLSASKLAAFNAKDMPDQVRTLVQCGYIGSGDLLTEFTAERILPSSDTDITGGNFGNLNFGQVMQDDNQAAGVIMGKLLGDNLASSAAIEMTGYDYHVGGNRTNQDNRDTQLGVTVGLAIETAYRKNAPLFVTIVSDGSVSARAGGNDAGTDRPAFRADSGSRGGIVMVAMDPAGPPAMLKTQIGAFNDAGAVDTSYLFTSNSPQLGALGAVYNFAAFAGRIDGFNSQMQAAGLNNPFNQNDYLAFAPKS